jgi:DNA-binding PadR family transcriptional regulator
MGKVSKELVGASAAKIILSVLAHGDNYGYEILQKVKELSNGQIKWNEGSIYPVLKKMEAQGMIKSYWKMEENERPRKYYNLLEAGQAELQTKKDEWNMVHTMLTRLWDPQTK